MGSDGRGAGVSVLRRRSVGVGVCFLGSSLKAVVLQCCRHMDLSVAAAGVLGRGSVEGTGVSSVARPECHEGVGVHGMEGVREGYPGWRRHAPPPRNQLGM